MHVEVSSTAYWPKYVCQKIYLGLVSKRNH